MVVSAGGVGQLWMRRALAIVTAVVMASVNIFGGFAVTERMLAMYKKKER